MELDSSLFSSKRRANWHDQKEKEIKNKNNDREFNTFEGIFALGIEAKFKISKEPRHTELTM